ncbi:hypothetical protein [Flavonifractor sp. HCP28S3_F3]|uniref:hypothetical protein n=1 Tax=Flavonifractor sp. HCP28S3_F3 TaxID=3438939 RepID=UPI003F8BB2C3
MCCCNRQNRCCRCGCCSNNGNGSGGAVTLPSFPDLSWLANGGSNTRWPVYVSVPAFLMDMQEEDSDTCGSCGCCRG